MASPPNPAADQNPAVAATCWAAEAAGAGRMGPGKAGKGRGEGSRGVTNGFWGATSSAARPNSWMAGQQANQAPSPPPPPSLPLPLQETP
jgi:hypothetical protein